MSKIAIIYWSSTGNTEAMANSIKKGIENAGASADMFSVSNFSANPYHEVSRLFRVIWRFSVMILCSRRSFFSIQKTR